MCAVCAVCRAHVQPYITLGPTTSSVFSFASLALSMPRCLAVALFF